MTKYAYFALLYGNNEYFLGALLLGFSLMKVKTKADVILLVSNDVPKKQRKILSEYFKVVEIDYISMNINNLSNRNSRFQNIFTKLRAFEFEEYEKIMLIDIDMFVLKNMDHLFELDAPAASSRKENIKHGEKIDPNSIYIDKKQNRVRGSINAGLMLLEPGKEELGKIIREINGKMPYKLKNPEQDYLSYRYREKWTNLDFSYNCQFSMKGIMEKFNYSVHDIHNLHYSWILNPWELVLDDKEKIMFILKKQKRDITYYTLWAHHYRLVRRVINNKYGVDIKELFPKPKPVDPKKYEVGIKPDSIKKRIDDLYNKLSKN